MVRKTKGRQKLEMVKIPIESNLQVTFSKRRFGLFKKASELSTLCGAEVAIVVFSPGKKVFSFGHPSVESVVDRFINRNPPQTSSSVQLIEAHRNANVCELNMHLTQILSELEAEKKRGEELSQLRRASQSQCWWEAPIEELTPPQLDQLKRSLQELKQMVTKQAEKVMIQQPSAPPPQYFPGSSSNGAGGQILPFGPNMNMMPPPRPPPSHQLQQPFPLPPPPPHQPYLHPYPGFNPEFSRRFY